jgi:hypothetical protein
LNFGALNFGAEKCSCLGACCEKPCCDESPCDDMWAFEKCGRCSLEPDLAVREGSALLVLLGVPLRVLPGFANLSRLDADDLGLVKDLSPGNERARLSAEFAR